MEHCIKDNSAMNKQPIRTKAFTSLSFCVSTSDRHNGQCDVQGSRAKRAETLSVINGNKNDDINQHSDT